MWDEIHTFHLENNSPLAPVMTKEILVESLNIIHSKVKKEHKREALLINQRNAAAGGSRANPMAGKKQTSFMN